MLQGKVLENGDGNNNGKWMSLPAEYATAQEYFLDAIQFLKEYSWIYKTSNTKFITDGTLEKIPHDWVETFMKFSNEHFNEFPSGALEFQEKEALGIYQNRLRKLKPTFPPVYVPEGSSLNIKGVCPKKLHEITRLSELIFGMCTNQIDIFIDVGCGLGYLSEILYTKYNFNVLGLEGDPSRVRTAIDRQKKYYEESFGSVFFEREFVTLESHKSIKKRLEMSFGRIKEPRLAIIGLHACADLTITAIKLFFTMKNVDKLIIMPCCYHKLQLIDDTTEDQCMFINIPLSNSLKHALEKTPESGYVINRPFLRLASQQTVSRWKEMTENDHMLHGNEMFIRGILDAILEQSEFVTKNKNWKGTEIDDMNFDSVKQRYILKSKINNRVHDWNLRHKEKFTEAISKYEHGGKSAEILTCLQTSLQELCENIVLYDRICFIDEYSQESGIKVNASFRKIVDDKISPRCYALYVEKR